MDQSKSRARFSEDQGKINEDRCKEQDDVDLGDEGEKVPQVDSVVLSVRRRRKLSATRVEECLGRRPKKEYWAKKENTEDREQSAVDTT